MNTNQPNIYPATLREVGPLNYNVREAPITTIIYRRMYCTTIPYQHPASRNPAMCYAGQPKGTHITTSPHSNAIAFRFLNRTRAWIQYSSLLHASFLSPIHLDASLYTLKFTKTTTRAWFLFLHSLAHIIVLSKLARLVSPQGSSLPLL